MDTKKEISPALLIGVGVLVLALIVFGVYRAMTATAPIMPETAGAGQQKPATINGQPVPAGVPYDYAQKAK